MMKRLLTTGLLLTLFALQPLLLQAQPPSGRWSLQKANQWYKKVSPLKGCNFLPSTAVNSTEMWQAETFDLPTIDSELGLAEKAGYNSVRVFLQYLVWKNDPEGLKTRINQFLQAADRHGITTMFILFDDCAFAGKAPYPGPQDPPVPGVHNSGWTPSPGPKRVVDRSAWPDLEKYVKDIVGTFKADKRIIIWDMYNEPGNSKMFKKSLPLLEAAFKWAREAEPIQPLTAGPWGDFYNIFSKKSLMTKRLFELSDVLTFHAYEPPCRFRYKIRMLRNHFKRPLICTEWLFRQNGDTFAKILPIFSQNHVSWYNWGLVAGKTQTYYHWGSKKGSPPPKIWQHDIFHKDGTPYDKKDLRLIRQFKFTKQSQ